MSRRGSSNVLKMLSKSTNLKQKAESPSATKKRVVRVAKLFDKLQSELTHFMAASEAERAALRNELNWPNIGHITSMARAMTEETRLREWMLMNRYKRAA